MKNCIGCGEKLTRENRSRHQPTLRCLECFETFGDTVTSTLEKISEELSPHPHKEVRDEM